MIARLLRSPAPLLAAAGMIIALLPAPAIAGLAASPWAEGHNSRARLIGGDGVAGVELQMPAGWKTYWRNPGDAGGVPPSFDWSKSENLASAQVLYPAPKRFTDRAGDTVGYKGTVVFPVRLEAKDPSKPIDLRLTLDYGVCKEICIPGEAALSLAVAPGKPGGGIPSEIGAALARVPAPKGALRPGDPVLKDVKAELEGPKPRLVLQADFPGGADHADIFIEAPPGLYVPLPRKVADDGSGHATFEVSLDAADAKDLKDQPLTATLISSKGQSEASFSVD
jgi:DsbC/DsbD-like thiol-disulfide interchange protein